MVVTPENKTVVSSDNFLRVNLVGDFANYERSIPSFENMYLVTPRKVHHKIMMRTLAIFSIYRFAMFYYVTSKHFVM